MRLSRGYFALATLCGLALLTYSCSGDKKSSGTGAGAVTTTGTVGSTGTTGTTAGSTGDTTATTSSTSSGGATSTATSTSAGGATSTGAGGSSAGGATSSTDGAAGEGGEGPGGGCEEPAGEIVYTFDEPGSLDGWSIRATDDNQGGLADAFLMRSATEGVSCPGSLVLTIPFSVYGDNESAEAQANFTADWTGFTTLYASVKVEAPAGGSIDYLNGIQLFTNSAGYSMYHGQFVSARDFEDFDWHEIALDITADTDLTDVNQLGVQLLVWSSATAATDDGGIMDPPEAPETTTVYIDDIRLE